MGLVGINFLNIIPKLGKVIYEFFRDLFVDVFHGIYNQQIEPKKAKRVIIAIASIAIITTITFGGINYYTNNEIVEKAKVQVKKEIKKPEVKKETKKSKVEET